MRAVIMTTHTVVITEQRAIYVTNKVRISLTFHSFTGTFFEEYVGSAFVELYETADMYNQTRTQLTQNDFEFIAESISKTPGERASILQLTHDDTSVAELLHDKRLFTRSMTTPPLFLSISPQLFFYVFVYQALEYKHIADDDVVDYIAGMCVEFRSNNALWQLASTEGGKTMYVVDLLNMLADVDRHQQYHLRRYIGNVSLFLTGFFPDFIYQRSKRKGAPPLAYYERIGKSQYGTAAADSLSYEEDVAPVLNMLSERFVEIRSAINLYTDAYLQLNIKKHSLETIERQAATLDDGSFRESLEM